MRQEIHQKAAAAQQPVNDPEPTLGVIPCHDESVFEPTLQGRIGGSALISGVFRKKDNASLWVGKSNVLENELSSKAEACREKVASDIYHYYGVTVPKTALARLPIRCPEWANTVRDLGEMVKDGRTHTVYHLSEIIAGFYTFGSIPEFKGDAKHIILHHPEYGALELVGLGHVLAVASFIFDVDVIGGSGGNIGYQIIDGKAFCIKIDPGEAFNVHVERPVGIKEVCTATQAPDAVIKFADFPQLVKREFLETVALIVQTSDERIAQFFLRQGAESLLFHRNAEMLHAMPTMMIKRRNDLMRSFGDELRDTDARRPVNMLQSRKIEQRDILATLASIGPRGGLEAIREAHEAAVGGGGGGGRELINPLTRALRTILFETQPLPKEETMASALQKLGDHEASPAAIDKIWDLGTGDDANKQKQFREANGFDALFPFLQHPKKEIRYAVLNLVRQAIKGNAQNQQAFLAIHGMRAICESMAHESGRVQIGAMNLMLVYTHNHEANQILFQEAGVLKPLIALLKSPHESIKQGAMRALIDFAMRNDNTPNDANLAVIWQSLTPAFMITLLQESEPIASSGLTLVNMFIHHVKAQKDDFVKANGIPELIRWLGSRSPKMIIKAADGLRYLARVEDTSKPNAVNQNAIREEGGIVALLALLKNADSNIRRQAAIALYFVVDSNKTNQDMILAAEGIKKILDLLNDPDATVLRHAVSALHFVTQNHPENLRVSQKGGALETLKRVRPTQDANNQKHIDRVIAAFEASLKAVQNAHGGAAAAGAAAGGGAAKEEHQKEPKQFGQMIRYADLQYQKKVGEGAFGCVYIGTWQGQKVAIKELKAQGVPQDALQDMLQEGLVMMQLRHLNVMHVYGICTQPGHYGLVMQYIAGGSLEDLLKKQTTVLSWSRRMNIALRISRGMHYLHDNKILHRDLKSPNILLDENDNPKITDFGLVKVKTATATMVAQKNEAAGTILFMAPELFKPKATFRSASDVYSFALVLYEIAARRMPWVDMPGLTQALLMAAVISGKRPNIPTETPAKFSEIMKRCWAQRIEDRPNFKTIVDDLTECRKTLVT